jgi:ABC-2 type transport system permease protein
MQLYSRVALFNFGTYLTYPFELFALSIRPVVDLGFRLLFWGIVAASAPGVVNLHSIIAYFLVATALSYIVFGMKFGSWLAKGIKSGSMNADLVRPTNILPYNFAAMLGGMGVTYAVAAVFLTAGLILAPPASWLAVLLFLAYMPMAIAISYGLNVLIGTVAFYTTEAGGIKNVAAHITNVFSGAIIPLSLFPHTIKNVVLLLPFATEVYGPVQALRVTHMTAAIWGGLAVGLMWAVGLLALGSWAWHQGLKHYDAIGI